MREKQIRCVNRLLRDNSRIISNAGKAWKNATLHLDARLREMSSVDLHFKFRKYRTERFSHERKQRERQSHL